MGNNRKSENTIVKDAIALFGITLIAGLLLGLVYQITKAPIMEAEFKAKQEAYQTIFKDAETFEPEGRLTTAVEGSAEFFAKNNITGAEISEALLAKNQEGDTIGYVLSIIGTEGYGGDIVMTLGIDMKGTITGVEILSMNETAGLGAKCNDKEFKNQYIGINADNIVLTKTGKKTDNEIDAISGATITTSAVTKAVNAGLAFIKQDYDTSN